MFRITLLLVLVAATPFSLLAQPSVRDVVPFPQQAVILPSEVFAITDDIPGEIVIGNAASEFTRDVADTLVQKIAAVSDLRLNIVTVNSRHNNVIPLFFGLEGELPGIDTLIERYEHNFGDLTLKPEGYLHIAEFGTFLLYGADPNGLTYGCQTYAQLIQGAGPALYESPVLIYDWPDFPDRILRTSTNYQVAANIPPQIALAQRAWNSRMNKIAINDVKFNRLDQVPDFYFDNVRTYRAELSRLNLEAIPGVADFGYSEGMLWDNPNLAEGLPVRNARLVIENGVGRLIPDPGMRIANGGFENVQNNRFADFTNQENAGVSVFDDQNVVHSGGHSVRMENFRQGNGAGNCRFQMLLDCEPFRNYYFSIWVRTEDFSADWGIQTIPYVWQNDQLGKMLAYPDFGVTGDNDWRKLEINFNSLENEQIRLYFGVWGGDQGRVWFDDAELREIAFVNLLRREGCPLTITSADGQTVYQEGQDFEQLIDPECGNVQWPGDYNVYHEPPELTITGNRIEEGDTILASFYHPVLIYYGQVMCCPSEDETYRWLEEDAERITALWEPKSFFMNYDEIRVLNWDEACQSRGLTPAEILSSSVARCRDIYRRQVEDCGLYVWSDMFDPFHNAVENYYLVNGSLEGAGEELPEDIAIVNWNSSWRGEPLWYFSEQGHECVGSADCSNSLMPAREWGERLRRNGSRGMMFTVWNNQYDHLENAATYMWSMGPHVIVTAPDATAPLHEVNFEFRVFIGDDQASEAIELWTMSLKGGNGEELAFFEHEEDEIYNVTVDFGGVNTVLYWIDGADSRGNWFNTPLYYVLGDIPESLPNPPPNSPHQFRVSGASPNPFNSSTLLKFEAPKSGEAKVRVTDANGRQILATTILAKIGLNELLLDASKWPSGNYLAQIEWESKRFTTRLTCLK